MQISIIREISYGHNKQILAASFAGRNEEDIIFLTGEGEIIEYATSDSSSEELFTVKSSFTYTDGGFDLSSPCAIYAMEEMIVVVNRFRRHGFVYNMAEEQRIHLWRGEYHAEISDYPVALYQNEAGIPHLIYAADWNHLQIMNLQTLQVLTAAKSLIEKNAEEDHAAFIEKYPGHNNDPWPRPYDYFYARLSVSPGNTYFLSAGWVWGSHDSYNVYNIAEFLSSNRIEEIPIFSGEHENRASCWMDDATVAVAYNPSLEEDAVPGAPCELHIYRIVNDIASLEKKIQIVGVDICQTTLEFDRELNAFVAFSDKTGVLVFSTEGKLLLREEQLKVQLYHARSRSFMRWDNSDIAVYQLSQ